MPTSFDTITIVFGVAVVLSLAGAAIAWWWARQARHELKRLSQELRRSDRAQQELLQQVDRTLNDAPEWLRHALRPLEEVTGKLEADIARLVAEIQQIGGVGVSPADEANPTSTSDARPRRDDRGKAVDLRDGSIVGSRALAAPAFLIPDEGDEASLLYLNEDVEVDHLALERWSQYFDFGAGAAYHRYRTVEPARVEWNASAERGRLVAPGKAEVL